MTGDGARTGADAATILLVHHFALPSVTGLTVTVDELLRLVPEVDPTVRVRALDYEACRGPAHLVARLRRDHGNTTCVVGFNLHIDVDEELSRSLAGWAAGESLPFYLYVHDYWPHHARPLRALVDRYGARILTITPDIGRALAGDGFPSTLLPAGVPLPGRAASCGTAVAPGGTVAALGRLVPRKRFTDVVSGFCSVARPQHRLLLRLLPSLVYPSEQDDRRLAEVRAAIAACRRPGAVAVERRPRTPTDYSPWAVYVSASEYEGLSMTPIESVAQGCPVLVSDIPPHRAIVDRLYPGRREEVMFPVGDHATLGVLLADELSTGRRRAELANRREEVARLVEQQWSLRATARALVRLAGEEGRP